MALKAPGILAFLLSIVLALAVLFAKFFGAAVPLLTGETTYFYGMLAAYVVLAAGASLPPAARARGQRRAGRPAPDRAAAGLYAAGALHL